MKKLTLKESYEFYEFYKSNSNEEVMNKYILSQKEAKQIINNYKLANMFVSMFFISNFIFFFTAFDSIFKIPFLSEFSAETAYLTAILINIFVKAKTYKTTITITGILWVSIIVLNIYQMSFNFIVAMIYLLLQMFFIVYVIKLKYNFKILNENIVFISFIVIWNVFFKPKETILLYFTFAGLILIITSIAFNYDRYKRIKDKI